jgi:erythronate-4-phosphate dehydrogenase
MHIVADENIPAVADAFGPLGTVTLVNGRTLTAAQVRDADILLVRSVTRVDAGLLDGSRVRFVGSATIGFDHVDRDYLAARGIGFATAPGSNATSAAEYVLSALLVLAQRQGQPLAGRSVGIIGCGNVGSRVRAYLTALGMRCCINDPPRQAGGVADEYVDLASALACDVVTLHVPLARGGACPTFHLLDAAALAQLRPGAVLVNTARGAAVDNAALDARLARHDDLDVVLDVWEGEPDIRLALLGRVALGTPHIAGYSLDGKLRGTQMIHAAVCASLGTEPEWGVGQVLPEAPLLHIRGGTGRPVEAVVYDAVTGCYDVRADDTRLRVIQTMEPAARPAYFDRLRKEYPVRREFAATPLLVDGLTRAQARALSGSGFEVRAGAE